jgi:hypothetical protein
VNQVKDSSPDSADLVAVLATTLERLTARVSRDLDVDASESVLPDDPFWADTISRLAEYARECAEVLDGPRIGAVLTAHPEGPLPAAPADHLRMRLTVIRLPTARGRSRQPDLPLLGRGVKLARPLT